MKYSRTRKKHKGFNSLHTAYLHIKSFLSSPRRYCNAWRSFRAHGNQQERWSNINNHDAEWDERTRIIAKWIEPGSSVLEFGSGREQLKTLLPEGCTYQPSDIAKHSENTLVCDLNEGFPTLTQTYDVIIFSGVSEYIYDLESLLKNIRAHCKRCIATYTYTEQLDCIASRIQHGWVTHYPQHKVLGMIERTGFTILATEHWRYQTLYLLA